MKTETRSTILKLIEKAGRMRPAELQKHLKISTQAIHRHLRALTEQGIIEANGSPPFTQYALAGVPSLEAVSRWLNAESVKEKTDQLVCETRETFTARLPRLKSFLNNGLPESRLPVVIATVGEVGNNSFDHNLGQWRDVPGCWFESQATGRHLWIWIADRGQGIFRSLVQVHPHLENDQSALKAAFETIISGRAPERRGNGLKFVRNTLAATPGAGLACISGLGCVNYGEEGERGLAFLNRHFKKVDGTITLMTWRLA